MKPSLAVLVCGSRSRPAADWTVLWARLDELHAAHRIAVVVAGGAVGPDRWGEGWAVQHQVPHAIDPVIEAEWDNVGRTAGARRNGRMADTLARYRYYGLDTIVLAMPYGVAHGTNAMVAVAHLFKFRVEMMHHKQESPCP